MRYVEISAKSGEGVEDAFVDIAQRIFEGIEKGKYDLEDRRSGVRGPGGKKIDVAQKAAPPKSSSCC